MATMATMATPKLNLEKKSKGGVEGVITHQRIPSMRFFLEVGPRGVAMVAMVATSLKVTLGAVARHPGADVGYQGVLTGGTVAARVEAGQGHADSTPTRGAPIPSLGLAARRRDPCPIIDGHHGHHGHPSGETLKKILAVRFGGWC